MFYKKQKKAFTLVELIVVITILAILGTIAFISLQGYSKSARDSKRLADVNNLALGLEVFQTKAGTYPMPDGLISTGVINSVNVTYKGVISDRVSNLVGMSKTIVDPLDESINYVYGLNNSKNKYEIAVILENNLSSFNKSILTNNSFADSGNQVKIKGNYNGVIKFSTGSSTYLINLPSLIYNFSGAVSDMITNKDKVYFVVDNNSNLPYSLTNGSEINNKNADLIIQELTGTSISTLSLVNITSILNAVDTTAKNAEILNVFGDGTTDVSKALLASFKIPIDSPTQIAGYLDSIINGRNSSIQNNTQSQSYTNCNGDNYNGYVITNLNHSQTENFLKSINNGTGSISVSCEDGILSYGIDNITCNSGFHTEDSGNSCIPNEISNTEPNLLGLWHFNEGTGLITNDDIGGTNTISDNLTINGATWNLDEKIAGTSSLNFNGTNNYARIRKHSRDGGVEFFPSNNFTITAWINFNTSASVKDIVGGGGRMSLGITSDNKIYYYEYPYYYAGANGGALYSSSILTEKTWHHVAITKSSTDGLKIYSDGNIVATNSSNTSNWITNQGGNGNAIGYNGNPDYLYNFFNGIIDEVAIYNIALSETEIQSQYQMLK